MGVSEPFVSLVPASPSNLGLWLREFHLIGAGSIVSGHELQATIPAFG